MVRHVALVERGGGGVVRRPGGQAGGREPRPQHPGVAGAGASHLPQQPGVRGRAPGRVLRARTLQRGGARAPDGERRQGPVHLQQPPHVGRGQESVGGYGGRGGPGGRGTGRGGGHEGVCECLGHCVSLQSVLHVTESLQHHVDHGTIQCRLELSH